jgi:hypothetical protein
MKFSNVFLRILATFVAISVLQTVAGAVVEVLLPPKVAPHFGPHMLQWMLLANAITVAALSVLALRTEWRGWTLGLALAAIPLVIAIVNLIEGIYFLPNSPIEWPTVFAQVTLGAALGIPVWTLVFGRRPAVPGQHYHPIAAKSRGERAWKFVLSDFAYLALYFIAGSIIFPYVKDFYAAQKLPSWSTIVTLELLVRGPAFVVLCLLMVRMLGLPRLAGALTVGIIFSVLTGVALLIPNPYFPDAVRWTHFCEVTSSDFAFGAIVAWLWGSPAAERFHALRQAS